MLCPAIIVAARKTLTNDKVIDAYRLARGPSELDFWIS
jgi:hypothetical protein